MPRRSTAALTVAAFAPGPRRLEPPPELAPGSVEADVFRTTVASVPANHFQAEDMPLLCAYARAAALERRASEELQAGAVIGTMPSPWLAVHASAARTMMQLSVRLRIGPRSRSHNTRRPKSGRAPSYYDEMRMENDG